MLYPGSSGLCGPIPEGLSVYSDSLKGLHQLHYDYTGVSKGLFLDPVEALQIPGLQSCEAKHKHNAGHDQEQLFAAACNHCDYHCQALYIFCSGFSS